VGLLASGHQVILGIDADRIWHDVPADAPGVREVEHNDETIIREIADDPTVREVAREDVELVHEIVEDPETTEVAHSVEQQA
jgi:hypothetical protein